MYMMCLRVYLQYEKQKAGKSRKAEKQRNRKGGKQRSIQKQRSREAGNRKSNKKKTKKKIALLLVVVVAIIVRWMGLLCVMIHRVHWIGTDFESTN